MKKITFVLITLFTASVNSYAQIEQGTCMVGGDLRFMSSKDENDNKTTELGISPYFGYYVTANLAVGAGLSFSMDKTTYKNSAIKEEKTNNIMFTPFARYNQAIADKASCYGQGWIGISSGKTTDTPLSGSDQKMTNSSISVGVGVGLNYFVKPDVALDIYYGALQYTSSKVKPDGGKDEKSSQILLDLNLSAVNVGLIWYFGGTAAAAK